MMKVTIEHKNLTATTDDLDLVIEICNILQKGPYAETTPAIIKDLYSSSADMPSAAYLTITAEGITCDGKPTETYNGQEILCPTDVVEDFTESIPLFKEEHSIEVLELHCLQSSTYGIYAQAGAPIPDANGTCSWCRIKTKDGRVSRWVFRGAGSSVADCGSHCAYNCGSHVRCHSAFRAGVFGSLGN